eukprot:11678856-Ditylum_brightwellii.AAC.1
MRLAGNAIDGATEKALRQDNIRMDEVVVRQVAYHLFIWPVGITLDNSIFYEDANVCKMEKVVLKLAPDDDKSLFRKEMNHCILLWTIGKEG